MDAKSRYMTPQPNFPFEDLTQKNEHWLELMMANGAYVTEQHTQISFDTWLVDGSDRLVDYIAQRVYENEWYKVEYALGYGAMMFDVIAGHVDAAVMQVQETPVQWYMGVVYDHNLPALESYVSRAKWEFHQQNLRTELIVGDGAARLHRDLAHYAIVGAAISRRIYHDVSIRAGLNVPHE